MGTCEVLERRITGLTDRGATISAMLIRRRRRWRLACAAWAVAAGLTNPRRLQFPDPELMRSLGADYRSAVRES
jgi:hypothetical protein